MSFVTRVGSIIRRGPNSVRILASRNLSTNSDRKEPTTNAVQFVPKDITEELARKVENNDRSLREKYDTLLSDSDNCSSAGIDKYTALRKRLLYRSKQRGWLEVDLLLGTWADKFLHTLSNEQLEEYETFLNSETVDLFNIVNGRMEPPAHLYPTGIPKEKAVVEHIRAWASQSPLGKASMRDYETIKKIMSN